MLPLKDEERRPFLDAVGSCRTISEWRRREPIRSIPPSMPRATIDGSDVTLIRPNTAFKKSGTMTVFRETEARSADSSGRSGAEFWTGNGHMNGHRDVYCPSAETPNSESGTIRTMPCKITPRNRPDPENSRASRSSVSCDLARRTLEPAAVVGIRAAARAPTSLLSGRPAKWVSTRRLLPGDAFPEIPLSQR